MTITELLDAFKARNDAEDAYIREFGPQRLGPSGDVSEVLCIDGKTRRPTSPMMKEFYRYARWWRFDAVLHHWIDPVDVAELMKTGHVPNLIANDCDEYGALMVVKDPMTVASIFLIDDPQAVYNRCYFVFDTGRTEPRIITAGAEVHVFKSLQDYLVAEAGLGS
ncbi:MAG: hypothetical protein AAFV19_23460 [Pseudomonadota bacterium]